MKKLIGGLLLVAMVVCVGVSAAHGVFTSNGLRGRYTGHLTLSEILPDGNGGTFRIEAHQLLALTFNGKSDVSGVASATIALPDGGLLNCVFSCSGVYQIGEEGLGSASLAIVPTVEGCAGPATLRMSLLVGGRNRSRLDVTIDGAESVPPGQQIPIVGAGVLIEP